MLIVDHSAGHITKQDYDGRILNHKGLRKARHIAAKSPDVNANQGQEGASADVDERTASGLFRLENIKKYECCICGEELPVGDGVVTCEEHFVCNACATTSFDLAIQDMELFPARCCKPMHRQLFHLGLEVITAYKARAKEYYTAPTVRVYCINEACLRFIPSDQFDDDNEWYTIAHCTCGTDTCVGCKAEWKDDHHRCLDSEEAGVKPLWLPEYSDDCRIQKCPECGMWIEHKEACNHMTCVYCQHEFCFICLLPRGGRGFHDGEGCPSYGEPGTGYDSEGYELSTRGLHRETGRDRHGRNRMGTNRLGYVSRDDLSEDDYDNCTQYDEGQDDDEEGYNEDDDYEDNRPDDQYHDAVINDDDQATLSSSGEINEEGFFVTQTEEPLADQEEPPRQVFVPNVEAIPVNGDHIINDADNEPPSEDQPHTVTDDGAMTLQTDACSHGTESGPITRPRPDPSSFEIRQRIRWARRVPILVSRPVNPGMEFDGGSLTFFQFDHQHGFLRKGFFDYGQVYTRGRCSICHFAILYYFFYCHGCGVVVCEFCSGNFAGRSDWFLEDEKRMVDIIIWAEDGVVPFRAIRKNERQMHDAEWESKDADWGLKFMADFWEEELYQRQPFMYIWDFGMKALFEDAEREMCKDYWIVTEENVGLVGRDFQMTFRTDTNPFAPLFWEEDVV